MQNNLVVMPDNLNKLIAIITFLKTFLGILFELENDIYIFCPEIQKSY